MQGWIEELERRERPRIVQSLPCTVYVSGRRVDGTVENVSRGGMLVRLAQDLTAGTRALVAFTGGGERFLLETTVQNGGAVARSLRWATQARVGLQLVSAPANYRRWVERLGTRP